MKMHFLDIVNELKKNTEDPILKERLTTFIDKMKMYYYTGHDYELLDKVKMISDYNFNISGFGIRAMNYGWPTIFENKDEEKLFAISRAQYTHEYYPCYYKDFLIHRAHEIEDAIENYEDQSTLIRGYTLDAKCEKPSENVPNESYLATLLPALRLLQYNIDFNSINPVKSMNLGMILKSGENLNLIFVDDQLNITLDASFMKNLELMSDVNFLKSMSFLHDEIPYDTILMTYDDNGVKLDKPELYNVKENINNPFSKMLDAMSDSSLEAIDTDCELEA